MFDFRTHKAYNIPLVTIGVLSYNYSRYILDALNSLLPQTYPFIELIIVDDCSTDNCNDIITNWIKLNNIQCAYIRNHKNLGICATSNIIVKNSRGKYITFFATDDIMLPERIERQAKILEEVGEEYGLCYAQPEFMNDYGTFIKDGKFTRLSRIYEGDVLYPFISGDFRFISPTSFINMNVYNKIGTYNEKVLIEDYNFLLRVVARYKVKYCDYSCIIYRDKKDSSFIHDESRKNNGERYFYDRIISNFEALKFIDDHKSKDFVVKKITQYLKSLAVVDSDYFWTSTFFLLKSRYYKIPFRFLIVKIASSFRSRFVPEIQNLHKKSKFPGDN